MVRLLHWQRSRESMEGMDEPGEGEDKVGVHFIVPPNVGAGEEGVTVLAGQEGGEVEWKDGDAMEVDQEALAAVCDVQGDMKGGEGGAAGEEGFNFVDDAESEDEDEDEEDPKEEMARIGADEPIQDEVEDDEMGDNMDDAENPQMAAWDEAFPPMGEGGDGEEVEGGVQAEAPLWVGTLGADAGDDNGGRENDDPDGKILPVDEGWSERAARAMAGKPTLAVLRGLVREEGAPVGEELDELRRRLAEAEKADESVCAALSGQASVEDGKAALGLALSCMADLGRSTSRLEACLKAADSCSARGEELLAQPRGMGDLKVLKGLMTDLEHLPFRTPLEKQLRSHWNEASGWIERARAILSARPRTRHDRKAGDVAAHAKVPVSELEEVAVPRMHAVPILHATCQMPRSHPSSDYIFSPHCPALSSPWMGQRRF